MAKSRKDPPLPTEEGKQQEPEELPQGDQDQGPEPQAKEASTKWRKIASDRLQALETNAKQTKQALSNLQSLQCEGEISRGRSDGSPGDFQAISH